MQGCGTEDCVTEHENKSETVASQWEESDACTVPRILNRAARDVNFYEIFDNIPIWNHRYDSR